MEPEKRKPVLITLCMGSSCFARGNGAHLERLEEHAAQGPIPLEIELTGTRCENRCSAGPVLIVAGRRFEQVDSALLDFILRDLDAAEGVKGG